MPALEKLPNVTKASNLYKMPLAMLRVAEDSRDRTTQRYKDHYDAVYAGIVKAGGVEDTIKGYGSTDEESGEQIIVITDGRTKFYAASAAVAAGELPDDIRVSVQTHNKFAGVLQYLGTELRSQRVLPLTVSEEANIVQKMFVAAAEDVSIVVKESIFKKAEVEKLLRVYYLDPRVKAMIDDGTIAYTTALDAADSYGDDTEKLLAVLNKAREMKDEGQTTTGRGSTGKRISEGDRYRAELALLPEETRDSKLYTMRTEVESIVNMEGIDPFQLDRAHKILLKALKKAESKTLKSDKKKVDTSGPTPIEAAIADAEGDDESE